MSKLCHDRLLHRSTRTRRGALNDSCFGAVKINSCRSSRQCLRKRSASAQKRPKHPCPFIKTASSFLEPFERRKGSVGEIVRNSTEEPCHGWRASVYAKWVGVKSHIWLSLRSRGTAMQEMLKRCSTFVRREEVRDLLPFPLSPEPTAAEMELSMTSARGAGLPTARKHRVKVETVLWRRADTLAAFDTGASRSRGSLSGVFRSTGPTPHSGCKSHSDCVLGGRGRKA